MLNALDVLSVLDAIIALNRAGALLYADAGQKIATELSTKIATVSAVTSFLCKFPILPFLFQATTRLELRPNLAVIRDAPWCFRGGYDS